MTETTKPADNGQVRTVDLAISGMTCAACVGRVEKKLNRMDGVQATVNLAMETARVQVSGDTSDEALVARVEKAGYGARVLPASGSMPAHDTSDPQTARAANLKHRFFIALCLSTPVMVLSMVPAWQFVGWQWVVAALAAPVVTWAARPFHRAAFAAARHGTSTMDTLVSLGVIAATTWSLWALLFGGAGTLGMTMDMTFLPRDAGHEAMPELYFEAATMVTTFLLAGRWAESRSRYRAGSALRELLALGAKTATRLRADGSEEQVAADQLQVGDTVLVRPGEKIPCDATISSGHSAIDESMISGESIPVDKASGDQAVAGTIALTGALTLTATRVGADTTVAHIGKLVAEAQAEKAPIQRLADRVAAVFVPIVLALALATFAWWWLVAGELTAAFTAAVAVVVIACPCALGLATPTALLVGTGRAAQLGIVVKGPEVFESTRTITTLVWDKTGTLTADNVQVADIAAFGVDRETVLALAAAAERSSEHPLARAIVTHAQRSGTPTWHATDFTTSAGMGIAARVWQPQADGTQQAIDVQVGKREYLGTRQLPDLPQSFAGSTLVWVATADTVLGAIALHAPLREGAKTAIAQLHRLRINSVLLTGDREEAAKAVAEQLGIDEVHANVLPADKRDVVKALQTRGENVAMVGDGVNDAAALAQAGAQGLGMAMGSGTDVAIAAADITLMRSDPLAAPLAIHVARKTLRIIKQNLFWAFAYNIAAIPLAMAGLLNPMIAGAAMACSSVIVVLNSLRLRHAERSRDLGV